MELKTSGAPVKMLEIEPRNFGKTVDTTKDGPIGDVRGKSIILSFNVGFPIDLNLT
jgi:hypothetical protein